MRAEGIEAARRILCVFPRYTSSFGTFEYAYPLTDGVQGFHAAAGAAADRGLSARALAGALHRRKYPRGDHWKISNGRKRCSSAACISSVSR